MTRAEAIRDLMDMAQAGEYLCDRVELVPGLGVTETERLRLVLLLACWPSFPMSHLKTARGLAAEVLPEIDPNPTPEELQASRERGLALVAASGRGTRRHRNQPAPAN